MTHRAECQCGQLTVESETDPEFTVVCNCTQCQRRSGSAFALAAFFRRADLKISGELKEWTRIGGTGKPLTNHFCPECGTNVFWFPEFRPEHAGVAIGCLTTPAPEPQSAIFLSEKQSWLDFPAHWKHFQRAIADG